MVAFHICNYKAPGLDPTQVILCIVKARRHFLPVAPKNKPEWKNLNKCVPLEQMSRRAEVAAASDSPTC